MNRGVEMTGKKLVSDTERQALETGDTGFEATIINGRPDWQWFDQLGAATLTAAEQAFLDGPVEEFCRLVDEEDISASEEQDMPQAAWDFAKEHRMFGIEIPEEYGGKGFSALCHSAVVHKVVSRSFAAAINVMVPNSLGPGELILKYGTQDQKDYYLPRLARGEDIPCFGLTEPGAGSDATNVQSTGVVERNPDDPENGEPVIRIKNLDKRYITLAPVASLIGIAHQLEDPENLLGQGTAPGITLSLVDGDTPGLEVNRLRPMDTPFQNGAIHGDISIPASAIIGGQNKAGGGWRMLLEALSVGRSISLPSVSTSGAKYASYVGGAFAAIREQFGISVGKFGGVEEKLAETAANAYSADATRTTLARMVDKGEKPSIASAIAKYHATEKLRDSVNNAMDVHSGKGVIKGPGNMLANLYQAVPIAVTVEGANVMTRNMMVYGQGLVKCHDNILTMLNGLEGAMRKDTSKKHKLGQMASLAGNTVEMAVETLYNSVRAWAPAVMHRNLKHSDDSQVAKYQRHIDRLSRGVNALGNVGFFYYREDLKRQERYSARMGDAVSNLFMAAATLKKFEGEGRQDAHRPVMEKACRDHLRSAETALDTTLSNLPRFVSVPMRMAVLPPVRRAFAKAVNADAFAPSDELDSRAAAVTTTPGRAREDLTYGIFEPASDDDNVIALQERLFNDEQPRELKRKARKQELTDEEQAVIDRYNDDVYKVTSVDEYDQKQRHIIRRGLDARMPKTG